MHTIKKPFKEDNNHDNLIEKCKNIEELCNAK